MAKSVTIQVPATELQIGDVVDRGTKIEKIIFDACSKRGIHVNGNACYNRHASVSVQRKI